MNARFGRAIVVLTENRYWPGITKRKGRWAETTSLFRGEGMPGGEQEVETRASPILSGFIDVDVKTFPRAPAVMLSNVTPAYTSVVEGSEAGPLGKSIEDDSSNR